MALKKSILDIQAGDGLSQKISPYRLPSGKSAVSANLVKNKQGQLDKRLGFKSIGSTYTSNVFVPNKGLALTSWQQNLLAVQAGGFGIGGANGTETLTALSAYMPDSGKWVFKGAMPEVNVVYDNITSAAATSISHPTDIVVGDHRLEVWINLNPSGAGSAGKGTVFYQLMEISTGNIVIPSQPLDPSTSSISKVELILVAGFAIVAYSDTATNTIFMAKASVSSLPSSLTWGAPVSSTTSNATLSNNFAIASVGGDSSNFLLMYSTTGGTFTSRLAKVPVNTLIVPTGTAILAASANPFGSFGIRADTTSDIAACAFTQVSAGSIIQPTAQYTLRIATVTYSTMNLIAPTVLAYTGGSTGAGANNKEFLPGYISIGYCAQTAMWTAAWSPYNATFIALTTATAPTVMPYNNTRITAIQFQNSGGPVIDAGSTGTITRITYGVHLASRFLEANGILYCLGYIPSSTQGGYVVLAADWADVVGDAAGGVCWPMRPCGQIQTRTCLNDLTTSTIGPTRQLAAANFNANVDAYATASVSYSATAQGNKFQLASASIQFKPTSGYPSAQWGTFTAFGGALPTVYDGANVFEQNFLYAPDGNNNGGGGQQAGYGFMAVPTGTGATFTWNTVTDSWSWIVTYEHFDDNGNYHQSARSVPVTITGQNLIDWGITANAATLANGVSSNVLLTIPTQGITMRMGTLDTSGPTGTAGALPPDAPVNIGVYRTGKSTGPFQNTYFRVADPTQNGSQGVVSNGDGTGHFSANVAASGSSFVTYPDITGDAVLTNTNTFTTHPLLYGDGTSGVPGNLDDYCPPATPIMVRHKERLFVSRGNEVLCTKQRGELLGPGYNEQVNAIFVGNDDPVTGADSMDDKIVFLKGRQLYYVGGDGPADNGGGNSFSSPQPIPSDVGCLDPRGVKSTPEGVYFMSSAGLRLLSRALTVEYAGGPAEDEFKTYPVLLSTVLYPTNNKILFFLVNDDTAVENAGEWVNRDYVLDAWTTGLFVNAAANAPISATVAAFPQYTTASKTRTQFNSVLCIMLKNSAVYVERDPFDVTPYYDDATYINTLWAVPFIHPAGDMGRFRLWEAITNIKSNDPHGLVVVIEDNYGADLVTYTWDYATISGAGLPLSHVRNYYGRLGEGFQIAIADVSDGSSVTGQGATFLGVTCSIGVANENFKIAAGQTK